MIKPGTYTFENWFGQIVHRTVLGMDGEKVVIRYEESGRVQRHDPLVFKHAYERYGVRE